jgi:hypothetical protein
MKKAGFTLTTLLITALLAPPVSMTALLLTAPVVGATYTETVKLYPSNDAYVDQGNPDINYGTSTKLLLTTKEGAARRILLKFDISTLPPGIMITQAKLFMYCTAYSNISGYTEPEVWSVDNDNWTESGVTWNNQPTHITMLERLSWYVAYWNSWDVKSFVENEYYAGEKIVSLKLKTQDETHTTGYTASFHSKEATNDPYLEVTYVTPLPATIDIDPDTLNLKSNGSWITAYIELPESYDVNEIAIGSIKLTVAENEFAVDPAAPTAIGDYDNDGIPDLMVKFDRTAIVDWLNVVDVDNEEDGPADVLELKIAGEVEGFYFEGSDTIKIISPGKK